MNERDKHRREVDATTWRLGALGLLLIVLSPHFARIAYWPSYVEIKNGEVRLERTFPMDALGLPRPRISYVETVKPITQSHNGGHVCEDKGGPFRYTQAKPIGRWNISLWAMDCLDDPMGYRWEADWWWHLGALKIGPIHKELLVLKDIEP